MWKPIAGAPRDRKVWVYAPGQEGLDPLVCLAKWHSDAGFCIDELREPTLYTTYIAGLPPGAFV